MRARAPLFTLLLAGCAPALGGNGPTAASPSSVQVLVDGEHRVHVGELGGQFTATWLDDGRTISVRPGGHEQSPGASALDPDGTLVVGAWGRGDSAQLLEWPTGGGEPRRYLAPAEELHALVYTPDRNLLVGGGRGGVYVWQRSDGSLVRTGPRRARGVTALATSPNGRHVVFATERYARQKLWIWSMDGGPARRLAYDPPAPVHALRIGADRLAIVLHRQRESLVLTDLRGRDPVTIPADWTTDVAFIGEHLVVAAGLDCTDTPVQLKTLSPIDGAPTPALDWIDWETEVGDAIHAIDAMEDGDALVATFHGVYRVRIGARKLERLVGEDGGIRLCG